ncbi:neuraminidase-like domain-containing protein [Kosakonia sacchari]|uniref:Tc toxin subunit A-related protein n=1 Tax=Kosakonia sacchari TaxID=1158459 RepID=UPI002ACEDE3D|nr:neuraminidase-like domain-containing protein [Kosakonia sacchari]MDZ7322860.1 neuraminidase-like domain-containing protein [Kosakonia sacchari]
MYDSYYDISTILNKINITRSSTVNENSLLASLMPNSFAEIWENYQDVLSWGEARFLDQAVRDAQKKNTEAEARIFSRANPQLARAVRLGIAQSSHLRDYTSWFGNRAQQYVTPGSVASMFSPAGYLTELYREARDLHTTDNVRHLDNRRPDLNRLALSQDNMDAEVSTLSIANDIVLDTIVSREGTDSDAVMEKLSTWRFSGATPYHLAYESARQAILLQDPMLDALAESPAIAQQVDLSSLLAIMADVSPELYRILTEEISAGTAAALYEKNFGSTPIDDLTNAWPLGAYYDVNPEELLVLTSLLTSHDFSEPVQYYTSNILTTMVAGDDASVGQVVQIVRSGLHSTLNYMELLPQGGDSYLLNFSFNSTQSNKTILDIGTTGGDSSDLYHGELTPQANQHYSIPVTLTAEKLSAGVTIGISRVRADTGGYYYAPATFRLYTLSAEQYLLYLNKIIRLYKACHFTPEQMYLLIYNNPGEEPFETGMLGLSFLSYYYLKRYGLRLEDALVLAGGRISAVGVKGQVSWFTTLFNTPLLSNRSFTADGAPVDWDSQDAEHLFRASVIKRGFHVSGTDLKTLWQLAAGTGVTFTATAENLALLYRVHLLADVHQLTATELGLLLSVSPWGQTPLSALDENGFATLVNFVHSTTRWLTQLGWTVSELYLMVTPRHSTVLTPEISSLIAAVRGAVDSADAEVSVLISALAPVAAATGQLSGRAESVLRWLEQLKPGGTDVKTFVTLALKDDRSEAETAQLVAFCQALGQLVLLVRKTNISDYLLAMLIDAPSRFADGVSVIPLDMESLRLLGRVNRRILQTGDYAQELLAALEAGTLTTDLLAQALGVTPQAAAQALVLADSDAGGIIRSLQTLDVTLQWLDFAAALNCTPSTAAALVALKYTTISDDSAPSYGAWLAVSNQLQAGLNAELTVRLQQQLEELTSAALSNYYIQTAAIAGVDNREQLYAWLLIDGQVSSQVMTTRVAEAIASIQLYVNRCRNAQEAEVQQAVLTRQFFTDWDLYNKRYSTWAGVSQLVYYPENYIDPTVRTGQTSMMDTMLNTIGQSELSADTVGDAFKGYMTQFEKIANLDIVSAYHDNASIEEGKTWFIGKSTDEGEKYYWRSLQQSMLTDGKYPATAWSEWLEIGTGIAAYNNMVRPVVFNDRLYVVWVTERPVATDNSGTVSEAKDYFLSFSYLRHDGSWSAPLFGKLSDYLPAGDVSALSSKHLFCTNSNENSPKIMVLFYTPADSEAGNLNIQVSGLTVSVEHEIATLNNADNYRGYIWQQLDTQSERRINMLLVQAVTYTAEPLEYSWGYENLSIMNGNYKVAGAFLNVDTQKVAVYYDVNVRYIFNGYNSGSFGYNRRNWIDYIKTLQGVGHTYAFYKTPFTFANRLEPGEGFVVVEGVNGIESDHTNVVTGLIKMSRDLIEPTVYFAQDFRIKTYVRNPPINYAGYWNEWEFKTLEYQLPESGWLYSSAEGFVVYQQHFSDKINYSTKVNPQDVGYTISWKGKSLYEAGNAGMATPDWDTTYSFKGNFFTFPVSDFVNGKVEFTINLWAQNTFGQSLGSQHATLTVYQQVGSRKMSLMRADTGVQYLQRGPYRVRINTLFARQLVARATLGLDAVLSMETQLLQEPRLGPGSYITVTFDKYTQALHGSGWYKLYLVGISSSSSDTESRDINIISSGNVSADTNTTVTIFLPHDNNKTGAESNRSFIGVEYSDYNGMNSYKTMENYTWDSAASAYVKDTADSSRGLTSSIRSSESEPMDFTGANALYFWEMFFYVPAMVFQRLLHESKFDDATTWMKYIWNPAGYYSSNGSPAPWTWNVRPLEEDTSWNPDPLDSVDPDAVAQSDPMHYKIAIFMRALDLLIARGDAAYRLLERDTLNEAKMWYEQALNLLGDEPYDALVQGRGNWSSPVLGSAASQTLRQAYQTELLNLRTETVAGVETRTANSLLGLFYPQFNSKLSGYWQTLRQRLYNLRHNLSIDGQALYLPVYAAAANPSALLSAAVSAAGGGDSLPSVSLPLLRFPTLLESARGVVSQLIQFGTTLQAITERQDAEALSVLLQTQGVSLLDQNIQVQEHMLAELDADKAALQASRRGAEQRRDSYRQLYDENVNAGETQAMNLLMASSVTAEAAAVLHMVAAGLDMVPNIYGLAVGGMRYGALMSAAGIGVQIAADGVRIAGDKITQSEIYRRRRQEWGIQRDNAESEIRQVDAQLASLAVRREGVALQKAVVETQLAQTQAQLDYLQGKFSGQALYSWLRGTLSTLYYQFYDAALTRCLLAQRAWQLHFGDEATTFIRPGAWQGNWLGFMAGETLMLGLERMSQAWIEQDARVLEVSKTVSLAKFYSGLPNGGFNFLDESASIIHSGSGSAGSGGNTLSVAEGQLRASVKLTELNIAGNYPAELGARRRIKQVSVTLPFLIGPYQNIRAVLSYGGSVALPQGCNAVAVSHGMNDSGQFQLDFNDGRWLPFEGIPVDDSGTLTLSLQDVTGEQKELLLSLKDIILHIRYTITG